MVAMPVAPVVAMVVAIHGVPVFRRIGNRLHLRQGRAGAETERRDSQNAENDLHWVLLNHVPRLRSLGRADAAGYSPRRWF